MLFNSDEFVSNAGVKLSWKIECDGLDDADLQTLAQVISDKIEFCSVYGIPRGGIQIADALRRYCSQHGPHLIVDDVLTTGGSMELARQRFDGDVVGVVLFSRGVCPSWITPVFQLDHLFSHRRPNKLFQTNC